MSHAKADKTSTSTTTTKQHRSVMMAEKESPQRFSLLSSLGGNNVVMTIVYGFLDFRERLRLGEVSRTFHEDERRGHVAGVYGPDNEDIVETFRMIRKYLEAEGKPAMLAPGVEGNNMFSECFDTSLYNDWHRLPLHDWFDRETGLYDLEKIKESPKVGRDMEELLLAGFEYVNFRRVFMRSRIRAIDHDISNLPKPAPYRALFHLMEKHDVDYEKFIRARMPRMYGYSFDAVELVNDDGGGSA